jgi:hypothetical protein
VPKTIRVVDPTAPEIQIYRANRDGNTVGTIAMCTRDKISAGTVISWIMSDRSSWLGPDENVGQFIVQGHVLTLQRNECIRNMAGDWILFIDDDMTWQPDAIRRLVQTQRDHDLDMVGALCFQRGDPYQPTLYMREQATSGNYVFLEDWDRDSVVEVDATGMAFVLITKRLLERIAGEFPSLETRTSKGSRPPSYFRWDEKGFGEDMTFCQDAKKAGGRIFVDTSIKTGHIGEHTITEENFLRELAERPAEATELRREVNDKMGLPTVTAIQAAAKLEAMRAAVGG